jgi:fructokinase
MKKVIAFGEALIDMLSTTVTDESNNTHEAFIKFPGGAPANVAAAVGKLGAPSYFAGKVGKDMFGDFLIDTLNGCQVHTDYMLQTEEAKTALAFVSLDSEGERSFEFYRDASADLLFHADEFQDAWFEEPGLFHFCSNTLTVSGIRDVTIAGVRKAREAGFLISFDVNLRHNLWPKTEDAFSSVWRCMPYVDLLKVCAEELEYLCGEEPPEAVIARILESGTSAILVTDGGEPLKYYTKAGNGEVTPPKVKMVDSTAAGDAFVGGMLSSLAKADIDRDAFMNLCKTPEALRPTLEFASRCGAFAVTKKGAINTLPTEADMA